MLLLPFQTIWVFSDFTLKGEEKKKRKKKKKRERERKGWLGFVWLSLAMMVVMTIVMTTTTTTTTMMMMMRMCVYSGCRRLQGVSRERSGARLGQPVVLVDCRLPHRPHAWLVVLPSVYTVTGKCTLSQVSLYSHNQGYLYTCLYMHAQSQANVYSLADWVKCECTSHTHR